MTLIKKLTFFLNLYFITNINTIAEFIKYLEIEHAQEYTEFYHLQNLDRQI